MKSWIFLIAMLFSFGALNAQNETLFKHVRVVGGFGAPITEYGIGNDFNTSVGGGGGIVLNSFFIGGYGLASVDFNQLYEEGDVDVLDIGHGGIWLGGTYKPHKLLHIYGSARLGWGAMNIELNDNTPYRDLDKIFVATPEIGVEMNVTGWFRVAGTIGYRAVSGADESFGYKNEDFSGTIGAITLRFGWFGNRRWND